MKILNIFLLLSLASLFGCQKSDRDKDTTSNSSTDYAMGQGIVYDVFKIVHQAANSSKGITSNNLADTTSLFGCDTLIVDTTSHPMTITIQFNGTCTGNNIDRTGSITATFSSKYDAFGCVVSVSFNNYTYKNYPITSTISYIYTGLTGTFPSYAYTANKVIIQNNNKFIEWSGNQKLTITTGENTAITTDDSYTISGTASGLTYAGNSFTTTINTDLTLLGDCEWISSGIVTVTPNNKTPRILDFGSSCDDKAIVKIYGIDYEIIIP